ncbi:MAG: hypothetical protein ABEJ46_02640 [Gemmatimonadota bacterium]
MTDRTFPRNAALTATGLLVGAAALLWSAGGPDVDVPARPGAVAIELAAEIPVEAEPMPEIRVPALGPPAALCAARGEEIHVPPRPRVTLADLSVDDAVEPLPGIVVPELRRPWVRLPRMVSA